MNFLSISLRRVLAVALTVFASYDMMYAQKVQKPFLQSADIHPNYWNVSKQYNAYFDQLKEEILTQDPSNTNPLKGTGYKVFKREEWFWRTRVDGNGNFPPADNIYRAYQQIQQQETENQKNPALAQSAWRELGPTTAQGGYFGIGRVMRIVPEPGSTTRWWVCSAGGGVWRTTNSGTSWSAVGHTSLPTLSTSDLVFDPDFATNQTVYLASGDYVGSGYSGGQNSVGILKSTNGGTTWTTTGWTINASSNWRIARLLMNTQTKRLIAAANAMIRYSDNGGTTWTDATGITFGTVFRDMMFKADDQTVLVAGTSDGRIFRSINSGTSWTMVQQVPTNGGRVALGSSIANPSRMYAVVANSSTDGLHSFWRSDDAGVTWSVVYQPTSFSSTNPNILSGTRQTQQTSTSTSGQGSYDLCCAVSPTDANLVVVGGVNLYRTANGGTTWNQISHWSSVSGVPTVHADHHTLNYVSSSLLLIGTDGGVYFSANDGTSFTERNQGLAITQFYRLGVSATANSSILAGAQDNSSWLLTGSTWTNTAATGDGMEQLISYANGNEMYTASYYGDIQRSTNGGNSWTAWLRSDGTNQNEKGDWVTPYIQHPANPSTILVGKLNVWEWNGTVWSNKSNNQITPSDVSMEIIRYAPSSPTTIYAIKNGFLWVTTNDGATWTMRTRPNTNLMITNLDVHPTDANRIWVTIGGFTGGRVYASNDAGATWIDFSTNLPQVQMSTILVQRNAPERLYVGHDAGVHYRDNSTSGWQPLMTSLPNVPVTELEAQYTANVLRASTYGRGAWETDLLAASNSSTALSLSQNSASLTANGGNVSIAVTSSVAWSASSNQSWCTVSPASASSSATLVITAQANTSASTRTATITVSAGGSAQSITITQAGATPVLSVNTNTAGVSASAGSATVNLTANVIWTASSNQSWCTVSPASGNANATLTISATANTSISQRTATITISGTNVASQTITFTQTAASSNLSLSTNALSVSANGSTVTANVLSNLAWSASSNQSWCTVTPSTGTNNGTLTMVVQANTTNTARTATITVASPGTSTQLLVITQAARCGGTLQQETGTISIGANYEDNADCRWLIQPPSGNRIRLSFTSFSTETDYDFVTVYDGADITAPVLGRWSGTTLPQSVQSSGSAMLVRFTSDESVQGQGWSASFASITPSVLTVTPSAIVLSASAASTTVSVNSNVAWSVSSNQSWCTVTPTSGTNTSFFTITAQANATVSTRQATITVSGSGVQSQTITVTQSGANSLCGDVNLDRIINLADVTLVAQHDVGSILLSSVQQQAGNVNNDINCDIRDAALLARVPAGLNTANPPFPNGCRAVNAVTANEKSDIQSTLTQTGVTLLLPTDAITTTARDSVFTLAVRINGGASANASAWSLGLRYDSTVIRLTDAFLDGNTVSSASSPLLVNATLPNELRCAWYTTGTPINRDGVLVWLRGVGRRRGTTTTTISASRVIIGDVSANVSGGQITTGIARSASGNVQVRIVPQPLTDQGSVEFTLAQSGQVQCIVSDMLGRIVMQTSTERFGVGTHTFALPQGLVAGMYHVRLVVGSEVICTQAVVVR